MLDFLLSDFSSASRMPAARTSGFMQGLLLIPRLSVFLLLWVPFLCFAFTMTVAFGGRD